MGIKKRAPVELRYEDLLRQEADLSALIEEVCAVAI